MSARASRSGWAAVVCLLAVCLAGSSHLAAAQNSTNTTSQYNNTVEALLDNSRLTTLGSLLTGAGLLPIFNTSDLNATVFAPTNGAFNDALQALNVTVEQLTADNTTLATLLEYHVVPVALNSTQIAGSPGASVVAATLAGPLLRVSSINGTVVINATGSDATVTTADVTAGSTIIHVINNVLLPFYQSVAQAAIRLNLTSLVAALSAANLGNQFADTNLIATVFAPTNDAFQTAFAALGVTADELFANTTLLTDILLNHVILGSAYNSSFLTNGTVLYPPLQNATLTAINNNDGSAIMIKSIGNEASIIQADLNVALKRSVVHVIDAVLLPFYPSIAAAVLDTPDLSTLATALTAANLGAPFANGSLVATVFAPTNEAFNNLLNQLDISTNSLLASNDSLTEILQYHVVLGSAITSDQIQDGDSITTQSGLRINATVNSSGVYLNAENSTAKVVQADILVGGKKSVVHIIDAVLLPNNNTLNFTSAAATAKPSLMVMLAALLGAISLYLMGSF